MRFSPMSILPLLVLAPSLALGADPQAGGRPGAGAAGWSAVSTLSALVSVAAVITLAWLIWRFMFRPDQGAKNDPRLLLHELCQAHGLSRRAERLLRKSAAALGTPHPARFFLEPQLLEEAAKCEQLKGNKRALSLLHERLVGEDL